MKEPPKTIRYHYIKSTAFRVVHADGVFGGPTPKGYLQLDFFNERFPIPQVIEHSIAEIKGDKASVGEELSRSGREGVVREVEVGVVLDRESAEALRDWLTRHIDQLAAAGVPNAR